MKKIFIALPAYDARMHVATTMALISNMMSLQNAGHQVVIKSVEGNCYITTTRNQLVSMFLETDCTDLVFVDTDMWFEDNAINKLLRWDKDIVCGVYPKKKDEPEYTARPLMDTDAGKLIVEKLTGLIELDAGPTGLMRIQRYVLEKLLSLRQDLKYTADDGKDHFNLFETPFIYGTWWGEDFAFCHKAKAIGTKIWCDSDIDFIHIGYKQFKGNFSKFVKEKGVV